MVNGILVEGNIGSLGSLDNPLVVHRSHDLHRHYRCHCLYEGINQGMCETVCFSNGEGNNRDGDGSIQAHAEPLIDAGPGRAHNINRVKCFVARKGGYLIGCNWCVWNLLLQILWSMIPMDGWMCIINISQEYPPQPPR